MPETGKLWVPAANNTLIDCCSPGEPAAKPELAKVLPVQEAGNGMCIELS